MLRSSLLVRNRGKIALLIAAAGISAYSGILVYQSANALSGSDWRAGRIIDDSLFTNKNAMSVSQIQSFLESKVPVCDTNGTQMVGGITRAQYGINNGNPPPFTCLKDYYENPTTKASNYGGQPIPSGAKSAAQLIWEAGQQHNINPQVLIITLQKEQGLITDDWPFKRQYEKAMGAYCPDTAPCDPAYASFSAQMLEGAELFRYYLDNMNQPWWPYAKPGNRSVLFNPNSACGSSNVFIENYATAALYTYTPYQPNAAALANLNGTGDSCSAYGNRNFWRDFNNWFGPTSSLGYTLAIADNGDTRQWVIMNGRRHWVPNGEIKQAWGLPDTPITWDDLYLGSFPDGPNLTRLMRPNGSLSVYFVDLGKKYRIPNSQYFDVWNSSSTMGQIVDVSSGLGELPADSGEIGFTARQASNPNPVYLIDSGQRRYITDPNVLAAWAGDTANVTSLSDSFFSLLSVGTSISTPKITRDGNTYIVDSFRKLQLDSVTSQLYPSWAAQDVTPAIFNLFGTTNATYLIKSWSSPSVYLLDQNQKHHIIDPSVLDAWQSATFPSSITVVSNGLANSIGNGASISDYLLASSGIFYVVDKWQRQIPSNLQAAYTTGRTAYSASSSLLSVFPAGSPASGLIKATGAPEVYLLTNSGQRRHITSPTRLKLWANGESATELRGTNVSRYTNGGGIGAFVNDGAGSNFLIEDGEKHPIDSATISNWGLAGSDTLNDGTLSRLGNGSAITNKLQQSSVYSLVHEGKAFSTVDWNIADMWGTTDAPVLNSALVSEFLSNDMLTRIARSNIPGDSRLFIANKGALYRLYPNTAANLQADGPLTWIDPTEFTILDWTATVVKDEAGNNYVIDKGTKRPLPQGIIYDQWTYGNQANVPAMGNGFLNTLPTSRQIERAIKGSGPNIYAGENFVKRWIQSPGAYNSLYAPFTQVSDELLNVLPDGSPIN